MEEMVIQCAALRWRSSVSTAMCSCWCCGWWVQCCCTAAYAVTLTGWPEHSGHIRVQKRRPGRDDQETMPGHVTCCLRSMRCHAASLSPLSPLPPAPQSAPILFSMLDAADCTTIHHPPAEPLAPTSTLHSIVEAAVSVCPCIHRSRHELCNALVASVLSAPSALPLCLTAIVRACVAVHGAAIGRDERAAGVGSAAEANPARRYTDLTERGQPMHITTERRHTPPHCTTQHKRRARGRDVCTTQHKRRARGRDVLHHTAQKEGKGEGRQQRSGDEVGRGWSGSGCAWGVWWCRSARTVVECVGVRVAHPAHDPEVAVTIECSHRPSHSATSTHRPQLKPPLALSHTSAHAHTHTHSTAQPTHARSANPTLQQWQYHANLSVRCDASDRCTPQPGPACLRCTPPPATAPPRPSPLRGHPPSSRSCPAPVG